MVGWVLLSHRCGTVISVDNRGCGVRRDQRVWRDHDRPTLPTHNQHAAYYVYILKS